MARQTALITGATGGIGYEIAKLFAADGIDLVLVARRKEELEDVKLEFGRYPISINCFDMDLSIAGSSTRLYQHCLSVDIKIDYLVNNAGYGDYNKVVDAKPELYANMLQLNVLALTDLSTLFVKDMVIRGSGKILNVGSLAGFQPGPMMAVYAASKSYVMHFTEALHAELKGTGVTATVLSPGLTKTGFVTRAKMESAAFTSGYQLDAGQVASCGYKAMFAGKLNVVPGLFNKILAFATGITPSRTLLLAMSAYVMRKKNNR
ncbi:SDR family oxidoreductase [Pedobacter sp. ASV28]|uniref:SDR family NAD(P)-dependent oxidoreductase n=1 Tax=Pedobacter sp. ASV28 TaxID=2795123 RepID=UPI0018EA7A4D|nr:SDR family oxidoreductase [Pedobacter sp. ASV28]